MKTVDNLINFFQANDALILGKGPSLNQNNYSKYKTDKVIIGVNQVSAYFSVDISFFIDLEPLMDIQEEILATDSLVIMPWRPNEVSFLKTISQPSLNNLLELSSKFEIIKKLSESNRLFYFYNESSNEKKINFYPANLVSISSLLQILSDLGFKNIYTLGVDGGSEYSTMTKNFTKTQLSNGYDKQFPILKSLAVKNNINFMKANSQEINIYIGTEAQQGLARKVLEYSILLNTTSKINFIDLANYSYLIPNEIKSKGRTPFSMQRFLIPKLNNYSGLAIYLDSDMLVFDDIEKLISARNVDVAVSSAKVKSNSNRLPQYSVMVIDCAKAKWNISDIDFNNKNYDSWMFDFDIEKSKDRCISYKWNSLELYEKDTKLLHFTDMDNQPWISNQNKLSSLWINHMIMAVKDNYITIDEIKMNVKKGWVRPSVLDQINQGILDSKKVSFIQRIKDYLYVPPHTVSRFTNFNNVLIRAFLSILKNIFHKIR